MPRTAQDVRDNPVPGDTYIYPDGSEFDVILDVSENHVTIQDNTGGEYRYGRDLWGSGDGTWVPVDAP